MGTTDSLVTTVASGTLTMEVGAELRNNGSHGVAMYDGTFTMNGGSIYGNTALSGNGGGVYFGNTKTRQYRGAL
jgi:hypothetical protein